MKPDEVYSLASQPFVPASWNQPVLTSDVTGIGVTRILEAIRKYKPDVKFYQASSSEMFGKVREVPQNEKTHAVAFAVIYRDVVRVSLGLRRGCRRNYS